MKLRAWLWIGLAIWLTSSCASRGEVDQAVLRADSLHYELVMEQRLNDRLQSYIEQVCYPRVEPSLRRTSLGVPSAQPKAEVDSLDLPRLELRKVERGHSYRLDMAFRFAPSSTDLSEAVQTLLEEVADSLRSREQWFITVVGHCDNVEQSNAAAADGWLLSAQRAAEVVRFLISQGISPHRLRAAGQSKFQPLASNHNRAGQDLNRRVEILISPRRSDY